MAMKEGKGRTKIHLFHQGFSIGMGKRSRPGWKFWLKPKENTGTDPLGELVVVGAVTGGFNCSGHPFKSLVFLSRHWQRFVNEAGGDYSSQGG